MCEARFDPDNQTDYLLIQSPFTFTQVADCRLLGLDRTRNGLPFLRDLFTSKLSILLLSDLVRAL